MQRIEGEARRWATADEALAFLRQQLWVDPDGEKGRRLSAMVDALPREPDGAIRIASPNRDIGVVTWRPEAASRHDVAPLDTDPKPLEGPPA